MAHRLRSKVKAAEAGEALAPVSLVECRRDLHAPPLPTPLERRRAAQRTAERHQGLIERAAIVFRGKPALVQVVNLSRGGLTIESALTPAPGETIGVALAGEPPRPAAVRWVRKGRIGLAFQLV
ncbi:MAG: hypothetical protein QOK17_442 [Sphingomonadales bacterium]|jgi:hypothetical protein|nr:hypothetical protein [Sphingomonadales bacterium]